VEPEAGDDGLSEFVKVRPRPFGIAYRMMGSAAEAEDIIQDVWLRWQSTNRKAVLHPPAFLAATTTRLAINFAQSARSRREMYVGPWLPEPVDTALTRFWAPNGARRSSLRFCYCSRSSRPWNEQRMFFGKHSIIPIGRSPKFCSSKRRTLANG
jgi:hypothetical protein